ncbi:DUF6207 family protein [Streptomyces sp. M41]|uniref:DUF6207 family protein n=1 Tax=Streptomyces sp. M41 TaxID=3059412 RepID=UPI00374CCEBA
MHGGRRTGGPSRPAGTAGGGERWAREEAEYDRWRTITAEQTTRDGGRPGVRLRCHLDLRQQLTAVAVVGPIMEPTTAWC